MKKYLFLCICILPLCACEKTDDRTRAANIIYQACISDGQGKEWCRCLRADLIDSTKQFTEEMAYYVINGRQHPWLSTAITGARIRCECRMYPRRMAARGLSCANVKPINY